MKKPALAGHVIASLKPFKQELEEYIDAKITEACMQIKGATTSESRDGVHYETAALSRFKNAFLAELDKK